jgi:hypothetical protein
MNVKKYCIPHFPFHFDLVILSLPQVIEFYSSRPNFLNNAAIIANVNAEI